MKQKYKTTIDNETKLYYHILKRQDIIEFTYEDYLQCLAEKSIYVKEEQEEYKVTNSKNIHQKHDKTYKLLLSNPKEAVSIINEALKLDVNTQIKPQEIERYETNFITNQFKNRQADIVYKLKNDNIYFLIEHQSKIDYSIGYRIREYKMEITKSAIDVNKIKTKGYKIPYVVAIVLYTGKNKWRASLYLEKSDNKILENINALKYNLVDINKLDNQKLKESNNLIDKVLLMQKEADKQKTIEILEEILEKTNTEEEKEMFIKIARITMQDKIKPEEIEEIINKLKGGKKDMLDSASESLLESLAEHIKEVFEKDERKIRKEGKKEGIKLVINMLQQGMSIEQIKEKTGLKK